MEPYLALNLFLLPSVPSAYSNMWWAESLKESIALNGNYELKVLTEEHLSLDTAFSQGRYILFPTFNKPVEPGYYHINIQGGNQMFTGFMHVVSSKEVFWWGTDATDRVFMGVLAHVDIATNPEVRYRREMQRWLSAINYQDSYNLDDNIFNILKPF